MRRVAPDLKVRPTCASGCAGPEGPAYGRAAYGRPAARGPLQSSGVAEPDLSIVIPAHNEEVLLGATIDALVAALERAGGFDERYFASEEIHLSRALKRVGRFVILPDNVLTSARKAEHYSMSHSLWLMLRMAWPGSLRRREGLDFWYTRRNK